MFYFRIMFLRKAQIHRNHSEHVPPNLACKEKKFLSPFFYIAGTYPTMEIRSRGDGLGGDNTF